MCFDKKFNEYRAKIESTLNSLFPSCNVRQGDVIKAMNYSLLGGGKRIRPVLTMAVADMLGGNLNDACKAGCALECIHTYSLIHDDLPCMDNDSLRRGKPTCHIAYGEDIALLAGDGLLNSAFEILSDENCFESVSPQLQLRIIRELSCASGIYGMIGGQVVDLKCEQQKNVNYDTLLFMHTHKTGAMIRAAAVLGAVVSGYYSDEDDVFCKICKFSADLGLAFQIKDDILDIMGNEKILGKPIGSDVESAKSTFVSVMGVDAAKSELEKLTLDAKYILKDSFNDSSGFLSNFCDYLLVRNK